MKHVPIFFSNIHSFYIMNSENADIPPIKNDYDCSLRAGFIKLAIGRGDKEIIKLFGWKNQKCDFILTFTIIAV